MTRPMPWRSRVKALVAFGAEHVLMKGGHGSNATCTDVLVGKAGVLTELAAPRIDTKNTHGTGCTLSSSIAAELAKGQTRSKPQ